MIHHFVKGMPAKIIFGLYTLFVINLSPSMAQVDMKAGQKEILVIGTGIIVDGNVAKAKTMAISEALIKGVEEYLTRRLGRQGMINNFSRLTHEIIPRAREEIENFHILAEDRIDKNYKILVRVKVNEKVMEEKLREIGLIQLEGPPIKILFLVSQIQPQEGKISFWWEDPESDSALTPTELVFYRVFQERGFQAINRLLNIPEEEYSFGMRVLYLSDEDAIRWGRLFFADVVIHGRCEIIGGKKVTVILTVMDVEKDLIISQDTETHSIDEVAGSIDQIIQIIDGAVNPIAKRVSPAIIKSIQLSEVRVNQLEVILQGLTNFRQVKEFRDFLMQDLGGVKSVVQTRAKGDSIYLSVAYFGDEDKFLAKALNHENFPFQAQMGKTAEGKIIVNLR